MMSLMEAKMGKKLISLIAKTPDKLRMVLTLAGFAIITFLLVDIFLGMALGRKYILITKNTGLFLSLIAIIILIAPLIIKICFSLIRSKSLNNLEMKEYNYQKNQVVFGFLNIAYLLIFYIISRKSYDSQFVEWVIENKVISLLLLVCYVMSYLYIIYRIFKQSDEFFMVDQLWANFIAIWFYAIFFPIWWILYRFKIVIEPNDWIIYGLTMVVGMITLAYRQKQIQK